MLRNAEFKAAFKVTKAEGATHFRASGKRGWPPTSPATVLPPNAPCRWLEIGFVFACSIPPLFVLSHSLPMVNTMGKLASFGAFRSPPAPFPRDSRTTIHPPLASPPTFHAPRSSGSRRCCAPSWVQHSPPGRRQYAMKSYIFGFPAEVWRAWFSAQLNIEMKLTSISL